MYPDFCITSFKSRIAAKIAREFIHRLRPEEYFSKFMMRQKNPFGKATYILTFDFDFESDIEAFPYLLDKLAEYDVKAGFAVIGKFVEKYPDIHMKAVAEGHEIINHTYTHPDNPHWAPNRYFNKLSYDEQKDEILRAHSVFKNVLGIECIGFRTPHYGNLHTESVYDILAEIGYKYSSSTPAYKVNGYSAPYMHKKGIVEIPTGCSIHFPISIFDSWNMLRMKKPLIGLDEGFIAEFRETLECIKKNNFFISHYFDPYDVVKNNKLDDILGTIATNDIDTKLYRDLF